jgi:hypothetical protein
MKTGMEYPLIGLVILVIAIVLWNTWQSTQVDLAVAALNATAAGEVAPEPVLLAGQWIVKALVGTLIGGTITALVTALIVWLRREWTKSQVETSKWKSGPNANWGQQRQAKGVSESEIYRLMLLQQMSAANGGRAALPRITANAEMEAEDDPALMF